MNTVEAELRKRALILVLYTFVSRPMFTSCDRYLAVVDRKTCRRILKELGCGACPLVLLYFLADYKMAGIHLPVHYSMSLFESEFIGGY